MRAESFYNFATCIEQVSDLRAYGGKSLHEQSHGESFISLFANRFEQGIYILDEPEAALSPQRQLAFLKIVHDLATPGSTQDRGRISRPARFPQRLSTAHCEQAAEPHSKASLARPEPISRIYSARTAFEESGSEFARPLPL